MNETPGSRGNATSSQATVPMVAFQINLSTEKYHAIKFLQWGLFFLFIALLFLFYSGVQLYQDIRNETLRFQENHQRVLQQQGELRSRYPEGFGGLSEEKRLMEEVAFANGLLTKKAFSWTSFFYTLEQVIPKNISVAKIQPQLQDQGFQIEGKALSLKDLTRLILNLENSEKFNSIFLINQKKDKEGMIGFSVTFRYRRAEA